MCSFQGAAGIMVSAAFVLAEGDSRLANDTGGVHGHGMSNHAPLHSFEIIFYWIASLVAATDLAWYLLR